MQLYSLLVLEYKRDKPFSFTQRHLNSTAVYSTSLSLVLNVSQTKTHDYIDVSHQPSGRCTVLYSSTEQTSQPLLLLFHIIVYVQGAVVVYEKIRRSQIHLYGNMIYVLA